MQAMQQTQEMDTAASAAGATRLAVLPRFPKGFVFCLFLKLNFAVVWFWFAKM